MNKRVKVKIFPVAKEKIIEYLEAEGVMTNDFFKQYLSHDKYKSIDIHQSVEAIILSLSDMGFITPATHSEIRSKAIELGYKIAQPNFAFYLRLALKDHKISNNNILSSGESPDNAIEVFVDKIEPDFEFPRSVYLRNVDGKLWLRASRYTDDYQFEVNREFAFIK